MDRARKSNFTFDAARIAVILICALPALGVDFQRDVRPILSDKCFSCHGPNASKRPMPPKEILARVESTDSKKRMPPSWAGKPALSAGEIETLQTWVNSGADWPKHWAFLPVKSHRPPGNASHPIDAFIQARLAQEKINPSPVAVPGILLRRVSFDLTGLPPTSEELDEFEKGRITYEKVVDRLLKSPRFGERFAMRWLDAARYADTNGYQTDAERYMWRWRDWVINAFNRNLPFDQFITWQIAGDLLPNATLEQKIATGFNRNHRGNGEGGIIPEEYAVEYVVDRVETTSTVFLGLTLGCARCHDHKYDPFTQREFYQLYGFFNSIPERGRANKYGNSPPTILAPRPVEAEKLAKLNAAVETAARNFQQLEKQIKPVAAPPDWRTQRGLAMKGDFGFLDKFTLAALVTPEKTDGPIFSKTLDKPEAEGYRVFVADGRIRAEFVQRWLDDALRVETEERIPIGQATDLILTYDGSRMAEGLKIYLNGKPAKLRVLLDELNQEFRVKEPLRIGSGGGMGQFAGTITRVGVYNRVLFNDEITEDRDRLYALESDTGHASGKAWKDLLDAREARDKLAASIPTVMVMEELPQPRPAHVLNRGSYDRPGDVVDRGTPATLHSWPVDAPRNRLGLAKWLTDPANPLTARVTVNRVWQMMFGTGLVKTVEDFGSQGEWPSHPELLDWLAAEFTRTGWDFKALVRTIVLSETYRQSSNVTPELLQRDPENRLLARGPRVRLPAEMVRDQALAISGLLVEKTGGPSVKPYQPKGLWSELSGGADYEQDHGENLWRRSLYTLWKRASPPPMMMNFDAAGREACVVRESRTNTPLQALNLMNDVTYVEASRKLGERMMRKGGIPWAFRMATGRVPSPDELNVLNAAYARALDRFRTDPKVATKLLSVGEAPQDAALDSAELAANTSIASLILNLDEAVTKQ